MGFGSRFVGILSVCVIVCAFLVQEIKSHGVGERSRSRRSPDGGKSRSSAGDSKNSGTGESIGYPNREWDKMPEGYARNEDSSYRNRYDSRQGGDDREEVMRLRQQLENTRRGQEGLEARVRAELEPQIKREVVAQLRLELQKRLAKEQEAAKSNQTKESGGGVLSSLPILGSLAGGEGGIDSLLSSLPLVGGLVGGGGGGNLLSSLPLVGGLIGGGGGDLLSSLPIVGGLTGGLGGGGGDKKGGLLSSLPLVGGLTGNLPLVGGLVDGLPIVGSGGAGGLPLVGNLLGGGKQGEDKGKTGEQKPAVGAGQGGALGGLEDLFAGSKGSKGLLSLLGKSGPGSRSLGEGLKMPRENSSEKPEVAAKSGSTPAEVAATAVAAAT